MAPGFPVTASVLCTSLAGDLLLVRPARPRAPWHLPGGLVEAGEAPRDAARREIREELDLDVQPGNLLAVEWLQATRPGRRNRVAFVFAGPVLRPADTARITVQHTELDAWRWATQADAEALLHPAIAARLAHLPEHPGTAAYRETPYEGTTS